MPWKFFTIHKEVREEIRHHVQLIGDLERLISKVAVARVNPREMVYLRRAIDSVEAIKGLCESSGNNGLQKIGEQLNICNLVRERIEKEIQPDPPALAIKGNSDQQRRRCCPR